MLVVAHHEVDLVVEVGAYELHAPVVGFHELLEDFFGGVLAGDLLLLIPMRQELLENKQIPRVLVLFFGSGTCGCGSIEHYFEMGLENV